MAAQRQFAEPEDTYEDAPRAPLRPRTPRLANAMVEPRVSPARLLQDELRRAFAPGPIATDQFSARRALKFIAPTWLGLWAFLGLIGHLGHH